MQAQDVPEMFDETRGYEFSKFTKHPQVRKSRNPFRLGGLPDGGPVAFDIGKETVVGVE